MKTKWKNVRFVIVPAMLLALLMAIGCNTVEGAGEDVESAGSGIQDAAN